MKIGRLNTLSCRERTFLTLSVLAVVALATGFSLNAHADKDLNIQPGANSGSELVQIVVPEQHRIIEFTAPNLPGIGTVSDPYIADNATFDVDVKLFGTGHLVIRDESGNVLATYDKYTHGNETVTLPVTLVDGVGDYVLTAEFSNLADHSEVYGTLNIHVHWKPAVGPDLPDVPSTGYYYFAGFAVARSSFWACAFGMVSVACIIYILVKGRANKAKKNVRKKRK